MRSRFMLVLSLLLSGCGIFPESSFELAPESRLPKWFSPPPSMVRSNLAVTLDYYMGFDGGSATVKLFDKDGSQLAKVSGKLSESGPFTFEPHEQGPPYRYPMYEIVNVDGIVDIVEHRKMEAVFYMTDDPAVWAKLAPDANRSNAK